MSRMGVFLSEEGGGLAPLDLPAIAERLERELQEVDRVFLFDDLNTAEGIEFIKSTIEAEGLTYVVIGAGSADRREENIRQGIKDAGGNPYLLEMVNLREGVAWVHDDEPEEANQKAYHLLRTAVKRVQQGSPLEQGSVRVEQQVLVVGGGIAGMTAAVRLADAGYTAVIVERSPSLGGRLARLDRLWPRLDEAEALVRDLMIRCDQHENIVVYDYSQVESVDGVPGNFEVAIKRQPRYVVPEKLENLDEAIAALPARIPDLHQAGLEMRAALYRPFKGAVPDLPLVDPDHADERALGPALGILPEGAINLEAKATMVHERVGAIILAMGGTPFVPTAYPHLGYGKSAHVLSAMEMERLLCARGPTKGRISRPGDGQEPRHLTWLVDVGSDDPVHGVPY
ncbi:CoB--CoM heterodisulfide reductase iron-sulfur subunit A family protein, partial [bacterium]|nr:CoB--CoM heterodisulfide reductase iron-sulfur subunit A family protein [bacterium]